MCMYWVCVLLRYVTILQSGFYSQVEFKCCFFFPPYLSLCIMDFINIHICQNENSLLVRIKLKFWGSGMVRLHVTSEKSNFSCVDFLCV